MGKNSSFKTIDLFAGCGGLSFGFAAAGFDIVAGIDNWEDALLTFEKNHPRAKSMLMDMMDIRTEQLGRLPRQVDVVIGGPPCQGFSISGKRDPSDPRNGLYSGFVKVVRHFKPRAFLLENVPNLVAIGGGKIRDRLLDEFTSLGYDVKYKVLLASDYGVPQNRKRVVFVGTQKRNNFIFPEGVFAEADLKITCSEAISDLPESSAADGAPNKVVPKSKYQELMRKRTNNIYNHQITNHDQKTIDTIALVPDGGNYKDLPKRLQNTRRVNIAWTRYSSRKPSFTIDTGHRHHFHYKYDRIPTVRESARLQSFPDNFIFYGSKTSQYKQVGNAVPPMMAEQIAKALLKALVK